MKGITKLALAATAGLVIGACSNKEKPKDAIDLLVDQVAACEGVDKAERAERIIGEARAGIRVILDPSKPVDTAKKCVKTQVEATGDITTSIWPACSGNFITQDSQENPWEMNIRLVTKVCAPTR